MKRVPPILKPIALLTFSLVIATATGVVNGRSYRPATTETTTTETTTENSASTDMTTDLPNSGTEMTDGSGVEEDSGLQQTQDSSNGVEDDDPANSNETPQQDPDLNSGAEQTPDSPEQPAENQPETPNDQQDGQEQNQEDQQQDQQDQQDSQGQQDQQDQQDTPEEGEQQ